MCDASVPRRWATGDAGRQPMTRRLVILSCILGLFATFTNFVPLSVLPFAVCSLFVVLVPFSPGRWPDITIWAGAYLAVSAVSAALYDPGALTNYEFYRRDGNFFVTYAPLLLLPLLTAQLDLNRLLLIFLLFVTVVNLPLFLVQAPAGIGSFGSYFEAFNAAGGFLMFACAIAAAYFFQRRTTLALCLLLVNLTFLLFTYSRGSFFGLAGGFFAWYAIAHGRAWMIAAALGLVCIAQAVVLSFTYPTYVEQRDILSFVNDVADSVKEGNILLRIFENWPRALYAFFHSPIFGTGVGSLNDMPHVYASETAWFQWNLQPVKTFNSAHAHHTFLHILGEQGVVGLAVFLRFLYAIYRWIVDQTELPFVRNVMIVSFFALVFSSFTEHRLPSPSNAFPVFLTLLLYVAVLRGRQRLPGDAQALPAPAV
ncbi:MAG: O-antigen ligase family protein [Pseudomonadota bacterium]|nr:O-antigen ligase family protein [Pseudomonadota bacterium]